jgi:hypothetical protein
MVKTIIYFTLTALAASSVLAAVPEAIQRREASEADLLARESNILEERDNAPTMFSREDDTASLQEREPSPFFGALIGIAARIGGRVAARAGAKAGRRAVNHHNNRRRRRDLEPEDEFDIAARENADELAERESDDILEREMDGDDILEREVDDDLYLD